MEIQSHSEQHAIILTLIGRFTEDDRRAFHDAIATAKNANPRSVIADMTDLPFLDSAAVGILVMANRNLKASGISFAL
ncbi:MAG: STAS domain-containing protein, partial [Nitrospirota bacterium]|nr:STAS domain-containing protein [Nitrospirota bacterium]